VAVALAAVFVVAAAAYGLTRVVGSSSPGAPPSVSTAANGPGGPVEWLGMQVEGIPPGTVVVATVAPGSAGELAGLEPGDVIVSVNGRAINSTSDIGAAIGGLHPGDGVDVEVSRGSTQFATRATLTAPPSSHP
jgi:S1-C subfamily serine protease